MTVAREDYLGVNHWSDPKDHYYYHDHFFNFPQPLNFRGYFSKPSRAVDYRIYLPTLMEDFQRRGGKIEYRRIEESDIGRWSRRFDLLVVATGKGPLGQLFSLQAGAHALFAAAAAALRRPLYRHASAGPDERDAVGFAGARRDDRDSRPSLSTVSPTRC